MYDRLDRDGVMIKAATVGRSILCPICMPKDSYSAKLAEDLLLNLALTLSMESRHKASAERRGLTLSMLGFVRHWYVQGLSMTICELVQNGASCWQPMESSTWRITPTDLM